MFFSESEIDYLERIDSLSTNELRSLNRRFLHPQDRRVCFKCRTVYSPIKDNFNIKRYFRENNKHKLDNCTTGWDSRCKRCQSNQNKTRSLEYRKDYKTFIRKSAIAYRYRFKEEGLPFDIDSEFLIQLFEQQNGKCYYTGIDISFESVTNERNRPHYLSPSLDRLDPAKGYIKSNVVWCAWYINRMKNDLSLEEFIKTCEIIVTRNVQREKS